MSAPSKTVIEIYPDTHKRVKAAAKSKGNYSVKRFTSLMLDYALGKYTRGELSLNDPRIVEVDTDPRGKRKNA